MNTDANTKTMKLAEANNQKMRQQTTRINKALKRLKKCSAPEIDVSNLDWEDEDTEQVAVPPNGKSDELKKALDKAEDSCRVFKKTK